MGKIKKKPKENKNTIAKQSIHKIKSGSIQKDKNSKFKSISESKTALINNSKMQNENKLSPEKKLQKITNIKNKKSLQVNEKEFKKGHLSKGKKNVLNKPNKTANKEMIKKELEINDSDSDVNEGIILQENISSDTDDEKFEEEEEDSDIPDIFGKSLTDESEEDDEDFREEKEKKKEQTVEYKGVKMFKGIKSKIEKDDNNEKEEEVDDNSPNIRKNLTDKSEEDNEDFDDIDDEYILKNFKEEENVENENSKINEKFAKYFNMRFDDDCDDVDISDIDDDEDDEDEDEENKDKDENDEENYNKLVNTVRHILQEVREGKYLLPLPNKHGKINRTTIAIRNLPKAITEAEIIKKFEEFGSIKTIEFKFTIPERYKRNVYISHIKRPDNPLVLDVLAFVDYYSPISAKMALSMNGKVFVGNYITVRYKDNSSALTFNNNKTITIYNLTSGVDHNSIWKIFNICGEIENVYVCRNRYTSVTERYGFITFKTKNAANKAAELNGVRIFNRAAKIGLGYPIRLVKQLEEQRAQLENKLLNKKILMGLVEDRKEMDIITEIVRRKGNRLTKLMNCRRNDNNPPKKFKNNLGEAVACKTKNEKQQKSRKNNVGLMEKKPISFQGQRAHVKQKKNKKFINKQKKQMAKKLVAKPNKRVKV